MTGAAAAQAWRALEAHAAMLRGVHLRDLFAADPARGVAMQAAVGDIVVDYSRNRVTEETLRLLVGLALAAGLPERTAAMFAGERINVTEDRPVLHVALRAPRDETILVDGRDVVADVHEVLDRMADFAEAVRSGTWTGHTGKPIRAVVNIGIGGSHLGPAMACAALRDFADPGLRLRFVSNVDGTAITDALGDLDPAETLFVVCSKTFTTVETLANARTARGWLVGALGEDAVARHFVAVSSNREAVTAFGIDAANVFEMWDWVGGRYSLGSAIGLTLMIAIGPSAFRDMLAGFRDVDAHFRSTPLERNVPALVGLLGVWCTDFLGTATHAVVPYSERLGLLPAYLQQLEMESNGKSVRLDGTPVPCATAPVVWGSTGTDAQHAYFQLLHQGTQVVPCDLIGVLEPTHALREHHDLLMANLIAQAEALAFGRTAAEVAADGVAPALVPHRTFPGNRPTTVILLRRLTPRTLGQLISLYEHKVFTQGVIWGIDSFDQWGVELGKVLAGRVLPELTAPTEPELGHDSSTNALIRLYRSARTAGS
ncbi:MAG: glucose-6-phosphate isomerase [Acidimicrobiia bacterium]